MRIIITYFILLFLSMNLFSQAGIGTSNPQGIFNIDGSQNNASSGTPSPSEVTDDFLVHSNGNIGIGLLNPTHKLYVNGTARITDTPAALGTANLASNNISSISTDPNGNLMVGSKGFGKIAGGFRPGPGTKNLFIADTQSTILRVRFMIHSDQSNNTNNSELAATAYGDLVLIGYGSANPIKIIAADVSGYDGLVKASTLNAIQTSISIDLGSQQPFTIDVNQTTGMISISTGSGSIALSYLFEFFGGV